MCQQYSGTGQPSDPRALIRGRFFFDRVLIRTPSPRAKFPQETPSNRRADNPLRLQELAETGQRRIRFGCHTLHRVRLRTARDISLADQNGIKVVSHGISKP